MKIYKDTEGNNNEQDYNYVLKIEDKATEKLSTKYHVREYSLYGNFNFR